MRDYSLPTSGRLLVFSFDEQKISRIAEHVRAHEGLEAEVILGSSNASGMIRTRLRRSQELLREGELSHPLYIVVDVDDPRCSHLGQTRSEYRFI